MGGTQAVLLAAGAASLLMGSVGAEPLDVVLLSCGLIGVARATVRGLSVPFIAMLLVAAVLFRFWDLVPTEIEPSYGFREEHRVLYDLPRRIGSVTLSLLFLVTVVLAVKRVGMGLAGMAIAAWLISLLAAIVLWVVQPADPVEPAEGFALLVQSTTAGWYPVARSLTAAVWVALAFSGSPPKSAAPAPTMIGAIGAVVVAASLWGAPTEVHTDSGAAPLVYLALPTLGWILTLVGFVGLRADHGKAVMVGPAILGLQVLCCPLSGWLLLDDRFSAVVFIPSSLGLVGLAVVAAARRDAPLSPVRILTAALAALAFLAVILAVLLYVIAHATDVSIEDPQRPLSAISRPAAGYALVAWAVYCALRAVPPREAASA